MKNLIKLLLLQKSIDRLTAGLSKRTPGCGGGSIEFSWSEGKGGWDAKMSWGVPKVHPTEGFDIWENRIIELPRDDFRDDLVDTIHQLANKIQDN